ncbi:MAG: tyrosine-type recombinase/integrase [Ktedonobacteraceae bacterium]
MKSSKIRTMNAVKSLFTFCHRTGYLPLNVGAAVKLKTGSNKLAGRILTEEHILSLFAGEKNKQNHAILRTLYYCGLRVSELCDLVWANIVPNGAAGQINVVEGKGDKSRQIPIPASIYTELLLLRSEKPDSAPVFVGRTGNALDRVQVFRIVKEAAIRAGLPEDTSPHWLRHAHGTHALNHKAPIQLVKETLGHSNISVTNNYAHARPGDSSAHYLPNF